MEGCNNGVCSQRLKCKIHFWFASSVPDYPLHLDHITHSHLYMVSVILKTDVKMREVVQKTGWCPHMIFMTPKIYTHTQREKKKKKRAEKWGYKMLRSVEIHKTHKRGFEWTNFRRKFLNARMLAHMFVKMFAYEKSETLVLLKMWYALSFKITMFKSTWLSKIP